MAGSASRAAAKAAALVVVGALLICGCGRSSSASSTPDEPAAHPTTDGPSGLRPDAPTEIRAVTNSDNGEIDRLAAMAVADIEEFWSGAYGPPLTGKFTPVADLFSWDSGDPRSAKFCGKQTTGNSNAFWCGAPPDIEGNCTPDDSCSLSNNTIGWDRGELLTDFREAFGDNGIAAVLAHETGHAIQRVMSDLNPPPGIVSEQQADCFAGVYARWVTDGRSPRFTLNTGDGLNKVLTEMLGLRDGLSTEEIRRQKDPRKEHGSGFERVSAFEMGFNSGAGSCAGINVKEIAARRGDLPLALRSGESGENPVTEDSVAILVEALDKVFAPADPPTLSFGVGSCLDARPSPPASYCPSRNTLFIDVPELADLTTSISAEEGGLALTIPQFGDYTAYSMVVSRYMLAVQHQLTDAPALDTEQAGLRTACLTGVATAKMSSPVTVAGQTITLTAGDLDEAVAGVLDNGLVAADVNGTASVSGFARVAALRTGVLGGDEDLCLKSFS